MQISDFLVKKCYSSIYNFLWILEKKSYIWERAAIAQHEEFQIMLS